MEKVSTKLVDSVGVPLGTALVRFTRGALAFGLVGALDWALANWASLNIPVAWDGIIMAVLLAADKYAREIAKKEES